LETQQIAKLQAQAAGGDQDAELKLAKAYESGNGVAKDDQKAAEWCAKAASLGNAEAENMLGVMYLIGEGVKQDKQRAVSFYRQAAKQGNADAMFNLGAAYYNGDGVTRDENVAYAWFLLAKGANSPPAAAAVERSESTLKPSDRSEAYVDIARIYDDGIYLPKDQSRAAQWLTRAAQQGDPDAQLGLADHFFNGWGVARDFSQAQHWCGEAAKAGDSRGDFCIGMIYQRGMGVARNPKEARKWYQRAADLRNRSAIVTLAEMDAAGEGIKADRVAACLLYLQLIRDGDSPSVNSLADLKKQMSAKEWKKFESKLPALLVDPNKLNSMLQKASAN
jgi:TPR repeat protein